MRELVKKITLEMLDKGIGLEDIKVAIGCLESEQELLKMLEEVKKADSLSRAAVLALAVLIADGEI